MGADFPNVFLLSPPRCSPEQAETFRQPGLLQKHVSLDEATEELRFITYCALRMGLR